MVLSFERRFEAHEDASILSLKRQVRSALFEFDNKLKRDVERRQIQTILRVLEPRYENREVLVQQLRGVFYQKTQGSETRFALMGSPEFRQLRDKVLEILKTPVQKPAEPKPLAEPGEIVELRSIRTKREIQTLIRQTLTEGVSSEELRGIRKIEKLVEKKMTLVNTEAILQDIEELAKKMYAKFFDTKKISPAFRNFIGKLRSVLKRELHAKVAPEPSLIISRASAEPKREATAVEPMGAVFDLPLSSTREQKEAKVSPPTEPAPVDQVSKTKILTADLPAELVDLKKQVEERLRGRTKRHIAGVDDIDDLEEIHQALPIENGTQSVRKEETNNPWADLKKELEREEPPEPVIAAEPQLQIKITQSADTEVNEAAATLEFRPTPDVVDLTPPEFGVEANKSQFSLFIESVQENLPTDSQYHEYEWGVVKTFQEILDNPAYGGPEGTQEAIGEYIEAVEADIATRGLHNNLSSEFLNFLQQLREEYKRMNPAHVTTGEYFFGNAHEFEEEAETNELFREIEKLENLVNEQNPGLGDRINDLLFAETGLFHHYGKQITPKEKAEDVRDVLALIAFSENEITKQDIITFLTNKGRNGTVVEAFALDLVQLLQKIPSSSEPQPNASTPVETPESPTYLKKYEEVIALFTHLLEQVGEKSFLPEEQTLVIDQREFLATHRPNSEREAKNLLFEALLDFKEKLLNREKGNLVNNTISQAMKELLGKLRESSWINTKKEKLTDPKTFSRIKEEFVDAIDEFIIDTAEEAKPYSPLRIERTVFIRPFWWNIKDSNNVIDLKRRVKRYLDSLRQLHNQSGRPTLSPDFTQFLQRVRAEQSLLSEQINQQDFLRSYTPQESVPPVKDQPTTQREERETEVMGKVKKFLGLHFIPTSDRVILLNRDEFAEAILLVTDPTTSMREMVLIALNREIKAIENKLTQAGFSLLLKSPKGEPLPTLAFWKRGKVQKRNEERAGLRERASTNLDFQYREALQKTRSALRHMPL